MSNDGLKRIHSLYTCLSVKEKKIADYILADPKHIIHQTINELADEIGVADATVFRFCKRLGFKGYQAFKISLASEIMSPIQQIHEDIKEGDNELSITKKIFLSNKRSLENTALIIDEHSIKQAVDLLTNSKRIIFFGIGGSSIVAMDAYHKFIRTGISCLLGGDIHFQLMEASQVSSLDTAFFFSHSGMNKHCLEIFHVARKRGAKTLAITSFPNSILAKEADIVLFSRSEETKYRSEALSSRIVQLSLVDALLVNVMVKRGDEGLLAMEQVREAIEDTRI
ncbi:MurR/RpiR family transcriptional regulator [Terrilactibacillus laevilacticus]|uniref:MurR/RpiR family transcriptional regulator n=1 Tax=Terrilactibacillus laevilacticus TaxID=1380157 RepID=A0ABW5PRP6_9BACI|nr:MurR/RpiR family transcriptional regulator [Terrilactibacillus laevilacticus]